MTEDAAEDERDIELASITAIFPELCIDEQDSHVATLNLDVTPPSKILVTFHAAPDAPASEIHLLSHLPPLQVKIHLPDNYPDQQPPIFHLSTDHNWLPPSVLRRLNDEGRKLWEEYGRSQVVFAYIDFLQIEAERVFGLTDDPNWNLPSALKYPLLAHDRRSKKELFAKGTFECGVCLEPKKGSLCHALRRCGHVFCTGCLQDFYNAAITEGDIGNVKCLAPDCGMENMTAEQRRRKKQRTLHPAELLDIPLDEAQVRRYVNLKLKKKMESDKSTVYCPRTWCQGPAKSAKYAKYDTRNLAEFPDSDSETEQGADGGGGLAIPNQNVATASAMASQRAPPPDRLSICSICAYAFCRLCQRSWHGDHINCLPRSTTELTDEEKASYDYIRLHTSPCPTCSSPCQKTHGCNHMRCFQCRTHFCYLCSSWLSPDDPYRHFNEQGKECYMRLWELEEGDEGPDNQQNAQFVGPRGAEAAAAAHLAMAEAMQADEIAAAEANVQDPGGGAHAIPARQMLDAFHQGVEALIGELQGDMDVLGVRDDARPELDEIRQVLRAAVHDRNFLGRHRRAAAQVPGRDLGQPAARGR